MGYFHQLFLVKLCIFLNLNIHLIAQFFYHLVQAIERIEGCYFKGIRALMDEQRTSHTLERDATERAQERNKTIAKLSLATKELQISHETTQQLVEERQGALKDVAKLKQEVEGIREESKAKIQKLEAEVEEARLTFPCAIETGEGLNLLTLLDTLLGHPVFEDLEELFRQARDAVLTEYPNLELDFLCPQSLLELREESNESG